LIKLLGGGEVGENDGAILCDHLDGFLRMTQRHSSQHIEEAVKVLGLVGNIVIARERQRPQLRKEHEEEAHQDSAKAIALDRPRSGTHEEVVHSKWCQHAGAGFCIWMVQYSPRIGR
jgi:hypothetical protein